MLSEATAAKLKRSLIKHEGWKQFPYPDTVGKLTIGCGYNLSDRGLDDKIINELYSGDVQFFYNQLSQFSWWDDLNQDRQIVLIDMAFMGWHRFMQFKELLAALQAKDYAAAGSAMLNSEWASQVKFRASELATAMITGVYEC